MNMLRKLCWLLFVFALLVLTVRTRSPLALALALSLLVLPLLCLPFDRAAAKRLKLSAEMPVNLRKGADGTFTLTVQNPTAFPLCLVSCRIRLENQLTGETQTLSLSCGVWPRRTRSVRACFASEHAGRIRLTIGSVRLYDCFGLIGVRVNTDAHAAAVVQPDAFPISLALTPVSARVEEAEDYSIERPGFDLTEIFQLRDYAPGDSPRQVHWKLSQKYGKLIVKDPSLPITRSTALLWERTEQHPTPARTDAEAEILVSLCQALLAQSVQFTLLWNEGGRLVQHLVRDLDGLIALLPRLLTARADAAPSGAQLLLQSVPSGAYSHLVYLSGEASAPDALSALVHLTPLVCGTDYHETDYSSQLSELTI